ncbi:maltodextrin ABC transporter, permease protein MdxF [Athalassotoga saccharophila]|nr:maltodextrin ABC transporter, permease protein MdxF [Athalassotoga saccharophila]
MVKKAILWILVALIDAILGWSITLLFIDGSYALGVIVILLLVFIDYALINPKGYPFRYMLPALIILMILTVYPIYFTFQIAFENYATGYMWTRDQAINILLDKVVISPNPKFFNYSVYTLYKDYKPTNDFVLLLKDPDGKLYIASSPQPSNGRYTSSFEMLTNGSVSINGITYSIVRSLKDPSQIIAISVNGENYNYFYSPSDQSTFPNLKFFNSNYGSILSNTEFVNPEIGTLFFTTTYGFNKLVTAKYEYTLSTMPVIENGHQIQKTVLINTLTGQPVLEHDSAFWDIDPSTGKQTMIIGYYGYIGLGNFSSLLTNKQIMSPFLSVFVWTFEWAALSVIFTFSVGLILAIVLNNRNMKFRTIYRTLLIIPWAIPGFISIIMFRVGFFNVSFGIINRIFLGEWLHLPPINWFGDAFWAKVALFLVNTWLGFPYMMVISLGALQSIPDDLYEAASIDGSSKWHSFWTITFPLLMTPLAPLLIASFAYNFNNFNVIYLLTGGSPPIPNSITPAGQTDILISYTYNLAFGGASGRNYGLAAAISILIFVIIATISAINFKLSGSFEEVNK